MKKKTDDQLEELQKQIDDLKSKYLRALADYQNLEKRELDEKSNIRRYAGEHIIGKLLTVLDSLGKAQAHLHDEGLDLVIKEFIGICAEQGVRRVDVVGKAYDPHTMECIEVVDGQENMVTEEVLPGYMMHGKLLRPAKVKVGRERKLEAQNSKFETNEENSKDLN